ncbi:hypothetical protein GJAV_G00010580 [Gymnothorax javanicus]|nr:hypothetical protein GJAV_G00010580 [Gymnothorax javanicus]
MKEEVLFCGPDGTAADLWPTLPLSACFIPSAPNFRHHPTPCRCLSASGLPLFIKGQFRELRTLIGACDHHLYEQFDVYFENVLPGAILCFLHLKIPRWELECADLDHGEGTRRNLTLSLIIS